ncbi:MAG: sulfate ABC transporter substrate-binding protein [Planctomycetaceae bacterium]|nr:sulfate ABC transporter substrate-binding protein [Planctomycetaceae bacterium]
MASNWKILAALVSLSAIAVAACNSSSNSGNTAGQGGKTVELLNVSYDPTRELWKAINEKFIESYQKTAGVTVAIEQSHGGSSSQARVVMEGLPADVVTLAMWGDTDAIRKAGLINQGWEERLPNGSLPYSSTIVFVVRKGNPKQIKDWPDLVGEGVEVITPHPKTSGNGKLSFLSAWGSVVLRDGSEKDALEFVTKLYKAVPVLDSGARGSTTTFAQRGIGDVHLTWENEAHLEVDEAKGELEIVFPKISIRAEPRVAVVDANVDKKGTRDVAEAYLKYLYTDEAQEIIAEKFYRPYKASVLRAHEKSFPQMELFSIKQIADGGWGEADKRFFADGAVFDNIYVPDGGEK